MSKPVSRVAEVVVPGPLTVLAEGFKAALLGAGYTPLSAVSQLRLMANVSRWLQARELVVGDLTERRVEEYLETRRARYAELCSRRAVAPLLDFLADQQVTPIEAPVVPGSAAQLLLAAFERYLRSERGLAASTTSAYVARADRFLADHTVDGEVSALTAADVTRAVVDESGRVSVGAVQYFVAALRAFLRFCRVEGLVADDLSAAALAVTGRRVSLLPRGISDRDAQALLGACDRRRAIGRRDYAVVLTMLRLGLRAGEVAALRLGDIDWRAAELVVHGKGRREDRLPLPADVGAAITGYLRRGRPVTGRREVFVTAIAPVRGLSREAVSGIVRRACERAGVTPVGAHRLRHTMAGSMVRAGVPLPQIGQVLRHRGQVSTAVYCRVDLTGLRALARPWPTGDPR